MSSESSTHQLVGFVTKMFPTFGYINNEIFFQRKCVIGPMVEVGDHVATSAVYQPNMPIKWSAEKVWRVQGDTRTRTKDNEEKKHWHERSPRRKSPSDKREHLASRDRDVRPFRDSEAVVRPERKRRDPSVGKRSTSRGRPDEKVEQKRRRVSPTTSVSNRSTRGPEEVVPKRHGDKYLLNTKDLIVPDIHTRYSSLLAPVDLYRVVCHWQDSFPLLRPFQCSRSVVFQTITPPDLPEPSPPSSKDTGFYVNVLLLSMPSTTSLHDKTIIRAESLDREKPPIRKYIKILAVAKPKQRFKAIGGPWIPELDGAEPVTDPRTLINSAIRICKDQVGLDLSFCTRWNRFLEFRYSRTEGSTARPTSVLFPGSQLWGRSFPDAPSTKSNGPVKPYHRIVVYFIPDIWTVMPTAENWNNVKNAFECAFSGSNSRFFPLSPAEIDGYLKKGVTSAEETLSGATAKSETPGQISSTATTDTEVVAQMEQPTGSSEPEKCDQSVTESVQNASSTSLLMDSSQLNEEVMQSPSASSSAKDKESADPEINDVTKIIKKSHDELNLSSMKVSELREQLKARNLPADGIKAQLLSRLKTAIEKEAEQARKLEEERKQKEKAAEEAAAKAAEEKKKETAKTEPVATVPSPASAVKISLKNYPSIVIQHKFPRDYTLQTVSLDTILESKVEVIDARSYEMILCVHSLLDMIRRDAVFTLFRALVTAGDRGVQAKPRPKSEIKPTRTEPRDRPTDVKDAAKPPAYQTIDVPLLSACTFLDPNARGYFSSDEVEEMFTYLGLPISRYQVRSLISKVADAHRIYYRTLTDSEVSPLTVKSTLMYSEIDDDEYLLELIRGGDAILDEQKDAVSPIGGVLVLHDQQLETVSTKNGSGSSNLDSSVSAPDVLTKHLRVLETERAKLRRQLQLKIEEVDRLKTLTSQIPTLKQRLNSATNSADDCRRRLRGEHDRMRSVCRVLEQQVECLNSTKAALRLAAGRLRGRDDSPVKKVATEQKAQRSEPVKQKPQEEKIPEPTKSVPSETTETPMEVQPVVDHSAETVTVEEETPSKAALKEMSDAIVPLVSVEVMNGLPESDKSTDDATPADEAVVKEPVEVTE